MKKIGKVGQANTKARRIIAQIAEERGLNRCEIRLPGCLLTWPLAPAHRHRRSWYKGDVELLADFRQWVCACQNCHDLIENSTQLTEKIFQGLRGEE